LARSHFSFEKRRKELDKRKKKEAKLAAKAEKKALREAGVEIPEPVVVIDEFGNAVEVLPEVDEEDDDEEDDDDDEDPHSRMGSIENSGSSSLTGHLSLTGLIRP
jgi:hypothetical protein